MLGGGVAGGAFFAFSVVVMNALRHLPSHEGIVAMQSLNATAPTPWFMAARPAAHQHHLYWLTRTGASSAHVLYDGMHAQDWADAGPAPTGWAVFGDDSLTRKLLDPDRRVEHWTDFHRAGHFPAMEVPELLVPDIRRFFRNLR